MKDISPETAGFIPMGRIEDELMPMLTEIRTTRVHAATTKEGLPATAHQSVHVCMQVALLKSYS